VTTRPKKKAANRRRLTELYTRKTKTVGLTWDTQRPGLVLRVRTSGNKAYCVVYSRHGRPRWYTIGNANTIPLANAREEATEVMLKVMRGMDPAADRAAERGAGTFSELAERYLEQYAKKHNKSWTQADALVRRFALPRWGKLPASSVIRGDIKTMMAKIEAPIVANQTLAAVSAIFSWGVKEEIVAANPCKLVERNKTRSRERVLSESELPALWKAFDDLDPERAAALRMILLTGQRPGEIGSMRREHIKDGWWEMPGEPVPNIWPGTKNGAAHRVWLSKPVQALLAERGEGATGFVFASGRGRAIHGLDGAMRMIVNKLGVERATPHDLRRTFSTTMTGLGFGRDALNRVTNHKEGGIASVYDRHGYADENKRVMEATAARIMALAGRAEGVNVVPIRR
jgi:integrase